MRLSLSIFLLLAVCSIAQEVRRATVVDDAPPAVATSTAPVELPPLTHYAKLWTESLFTTRAIPAPTVAGPSFVDNLSLSGTYELNGKMVAILIDKTTSSVVEAYIGEDNTSGIRIAKVEPGATPDAMRLQLQKGTEVGWISFEDTAASTPPSAAPVPNPGQPAVQNQGMTPMPRPQSNVSIPTPAPAPQPQYAPPPPSSLPGGPVPGMNQGMPQVPPHIDDVPLPPS